MCLFSLYFIEHMIFIRGDVNIYRGWLQRKCLIIQQLCIAFPISLLQLAAEFGPGAGASEC